ncbi:hypothetical protein MYX19_01800 [Nitrospinae bacterium AH-259-F20]|nr:hypothetical protein [Nitrospinae bacterium AH-259-F20]
MAEEPQDQVEEGEDVEKLLGEFGSLYAALTKHQRPMAVLGEVQNTWRAKNTDKAIDLRYE